MFFPSFNLFSIMFVLVFLMFLVGFISILVSSLRQWNKNNHSPRLTVEASVVTKRANVSHHHHGTGADSHSTSSTSYYATFQVESGDRMELALTGAEYGLLVEGDRGNLTFQGTRFLGFARK